MITNSRLLGVLGGGGELNHERLACKAVILIQRAIQDLGDADLEYLIS